MTIRIAPPDTIKPQADLVFDARFARTPIAAEQRRVMAVICLPTPKRRVSRDCDLPQCSSFHGG